MSLFRRRRRNRVQAPEVGVTAVYDTQVDQFTTQLSPPISEHSAETSGSQYMGRGNWVVPTPEVKYSYSKQSLERIASLDQRLQRLCYAVANKYNTSIIEGHRARARQLELFNSGASKVKVGKHNSTPSLAVDMAPYPIDWNDQDQFVEFGYFVMGVAHGMGIPLRWGGDFDRDMEWRDSTFFDLVHFEIDEPVANPT